MSEDYNRRPADKRGFLWMGLGDNSNVCVNNQTIKLDKNESKQEKSGGLGWVPLDNTINDFDFVDENQLSDKTKKLKTTEMAFNWVPFGENFVNTNPEDNNFVVPQRIPPKLKKKLSMKSTPVRRISGGSSSSLRRATFRVTPRSINHLNILSVSANKTNKKRRSGGANSSSFPRTPLSKSSLMEAKTPSSSIKSCIAVEEIQYISWINSMLVSKSDGNSDKIDSNQLILDCFNSEKLSLTICPTKEEMSVDTYKETLKWNQLRSSANSLYKSEEMSKTNRKIITDIKNNKYYIRKDRGIHADTGVRKHIKQLLLSYNPLWLRIGLETVFQQKIVISSQTMRLSLEKFIDENFLVSKELFAKYGHKTISHFFKDEHHITEAKKFILRKFLLLLNFLDKAKQVQLIEYNPCLFRKTSQYKSTKDLIISFARDYITGVGDITKYLTVSGFSIGYKQMAIEEFNFEATNLAIDMRCGIRLTRLAELTTQHKNLLSKLLYPVTNTTRKLHNVSVALEAFGDIVPEGITAKDIQTGNKPKTMELLDAIIFKYKTDKTLMEEKRFEEMVVFIQRLFRKRLRIKRREQYEQNLEKYVPLIQNRFRANRLKNKQFKEFNDLKRVTLFVQRRFRANRAMERQRQHFQNLKTAAVFIQNRFRANKAIERERKHFQKLKTSVILMQRKFRANKAMERQRQDFQKLKISALFIQRKFRANKQMERQRQDFKNLRTAVIFIQRKFRANKQMRADRQLFLNLKFSVVLIQKKFRATKAMERERQHFQKLKISALLIQRKFRANKQMERQRQDFKNLRTSVIVIQKKFRANKVMEKQRQSFQNLKTATIFIQRRFRANKAMESERKHFQKLKTSVILIQRKFLANKAMEKQRLNFQNLKTAVICIQRKFRANKQMKIERQLFLNLKTYAVFIQRKFRANKQMESQRQLFMNLKTSVIVIQKKFRANKAMEKQRQHYKNLKTATIFIQNKFRANKAMERERQHFQKLRTSVILIQRKFKANKEMEIQRQYFQNLKISVVYIQRKFRANKQMESQRQLFMDLKTSVIVIQRKFRANNAMERQRQDFQNLKSATIFIQRRFRANKAMKTERKHFQKLKTSVILMQRKFRANKAMESQRQYFQNLKISVVYIQRKFRANKQMESQRQLFMDLKTSVIVIQRKFRANKAMEKQKQNFQNLKTATIFIQRRFRANKAMESERKHFQKLKTSVILIQRKFLANKAMEKQRLNFQNLKTAVICIQRKFRANKQMKTERQLFLNLKSSAILIQHKFRATKQMEIERNLFLKTKCSAILIQMRFREKLVTIRRRRSAIKIQSLWRGFWVRKCIHEENKKIETAFRRIKTSTSLATEDMYLGVRTHNALQKLLAYDSLLMLAHDLQALDRTTKLSPDSCETLAKYGAVGILVQILNESNRSEPHKQIITLTINILLNLAKYEKTSSNLVSNPNLIETLFKIIKNFSANAVQISRQNQLISKLFTLLWVLLQNKTILEKVLSDKRKIDSIKQIYEHSKRERDYTNRPKGMKKDYRFVPYWQIARKNIYEFDNHLIGILAIVRRLRIDK